MEQMQPADQRIPPEMQQNLLPGEQVLFVAHSDLNQVRLFLIISLALFFVFCVVLRLIGAPDISFGDYAIMLMKSFYFQLAFVLTIFAQIFFFQMQRSVVYVITNKKFRWGYRIWRTQKYINNTAEIEPRAIAEANGNILVFSSHSKILRFGPIKDASKLAQNLNAAIENSGQFDA
jgi:hypothetical protein